MRLGFTELRRSPGRFAAVAGAIGFIVFLALILAALSDGLYLGSTGAYRSSSADHFVFSSGSGFELEGSTVTSEDAAAVSAIPGVSEVGRLSSLNTTATADGEDVQLSLVGADEATMPATLTDGRRPEPGALEVVVDRQAERGGLTIGSVIEVSDGPDLEVVGVAEDAGFGFTTAWADHDLFDEVRAAVRPELAALAGTSQALGVSLSDESAIAAIESETGLEGATPDQAINALPAAAQQKTTL
ncbi:MAG TPA: hypothetical protein VFT85_02685, partial [Acidimicrobiia bacterium]|nr:hypothetical protein [Acidimicrobiia bacterium]